MKNPASVKIAFLLLSALIVSQAQATISVKVFSRDESMGVSNLSKPRIYIQNTGTETINNFTYRYYFTTENSQAPMLEGYYIPSNEQIMLVPFGSGYYVQYTVTNANLAPGGLQPESSGNCVGLHYNNWSAWDKTNDFSNNLNSSFAENQNIAVYVAGTRIYGNEPTGVSGSVLREVWTGISGTSTDLIPVSTTPQVSGPLSSLDEPKNFADNFGSRLRGYITAPASGSYTFWIASDDDSKLYLSTNDDPANKGTVVASVTGNTTYLQWNKYTSQKSAIKTLVGGTKYYVEILHKDGTLDDNCSVGWLKPGQSGTVPSEIVPSSVLTPYVPPIVPATPTGLTATAASSQIINLSWTDASNNEFGFRIEMAIGSGAFSEFVMVAANQTSYQVTGLTAQTLYQFRVRAYNGIGNSSYSNTAQATTFAVPSGSATREIWLGITGTQVSDIPITTPPSDISPIYQLETPQQAGDYFGRRIRGYIIPPTTGSYTFWIASDDCSQLWLSTNDQVASKALIASVSGYTGYREWNKYSTQKSAVKTLTAGLRYYFEILQKENNQCDNLSVGWLKPSQSGSVPSEVVPGSVLAPFIIPSIPAAPSGLTATALSATQIDLTWTDNSNNEDGFRIERSVGAGPFVEIGTAAAGAQIYHDAGLIALTQYQYRIRSYNGLGNSGYSNTATAITLASAPVIPPTADISSFAVYSTENTMLRNHVVFNGGGAIGSNKEVDLLTEDTVNGNIISGNIIDIKDRSRIIGDVTATGTITMVPSVTVTGNVQQGATVATLTLPTITSIPTGTNSVVVGLGASLTLAPGCYKGLEVKNNGTLTLSAGLYTFTKFFLGTDTRVLLDVAPSEMIDIQIADTVEFSDRSAVLFKNQGYVPFIHFYTNTNNTVRIGVNVQFTGILIAPNGHILISPNSRCNGALYGKYIQIEPGSVINSSDVADHCEDSDGDNVQNILEVVTGTDSDNPNSRLPMAVPSNACIDNTQNVTVTYDYSIFYPVVEYGFAKAMAAKFPANSLTRPDIPLIITIDNTPASSIPVFLKTGYQVQDRYINFRPENGLEAGAACTLQIPKSAVFATTTFVPYQYSDSASDWLPIPAVNIIGSDSISQTVVIKKTKPIVFAGIKKNGGKTLYFDGGYVYSDKTNGVFLYDITIGKTTTNVVNVALKVNYLDYTTIPAGVAESTIVNCDVVAGPDPMSTLFLARGQFVCPGGMKIQKTKFIFTKSDSSKKEYIYDCQDNFKVQTGNSLVWYSNNSADKYDIDSIQNLMALYFSPATESFESANFGDGRIVYNTNGVATSPYSYEYFLTDHLGSTRMVVNDQGNVNEAVTYEPYGTMSQVGASTAAIPVRNKFTTKELDQEGSGDGMKLFYFGARYYDPEIGGWLSCDKAGQFWNKYGYTSNPVLYIDENGNWFLLDDIIVAAAGFVAGTVTGLATGHNLGESLLMGVGGAAGAELTYLTAGAGIGLISNGISAIGAGGSALSIAGGVGQVAAGAALLLPTVQTSASMITGWANGEDNFAYYMGGGRFSEYIGNAIGDLNLLTGGNMDFYRGNWVYSKGFMKAAMYANGAGGMEHFGHALFVDNPENKDVIAHEMTHVRQMVKSGGPFVYFERYNKYSNVLQGTGAEGYFTNPYELEAYYQEWKYGHSRHPDGIYGDGVSASNQDIVDFNNWLYQTYGGASNFNNAQAGSDFNPTAFQ